MASAAAGHATRREQGIVLLAMLALVLVAASGVLLFGLQTAAQNQSRHDETTAVALAAARAALIGWAVANPDFPGGLPLPDRNSDVGGYDGYSDCLPTNTVVALSHTIGLLPWRGIPADVAIPNLCSGMNTPNRDLSSLLRDGSGAPLLYAVAPALVRGGDGASLWRDPQVDWSNPGPTWLTVRGADGVPLSTRVAFIVFAPGAPVYRGDLGGPLADRVQDRDNVGNLPAANDYLDRHVVGGSTYDNADADGDFIMAPDNTRGPEGAPPGVDGFNDRLVYVTIDELLPLVTERVLRDVSDALLAWQSALWNIDGSMPWAAPFDDPEVSLYKSTEPTPPPTQRIGLLPIMIPGTFNTPFTVSWGFMSGATVTSSGTVTAADMTNGATFTPPGDGTCLWEFAYRMDCTNAAVASVTAGTGPTPWGTTCAAFQCQRDYNLTTNVRIEQSPAFFIAPDASETRTRRVRANSFGTPGAGFGVQIVDYSCTSICPSGASEVGRGTLSTVLSTFGFVEVSGVRHELSVVDRVVYPNTGLHRSDLPHWFVTAGWYKRIVLAVANGHEPGGAGSCTPGTDCLTVETLDGNGVVTGVSDDSVQALLLFGGWSIAANTGTSADPSFYFEADNADADEVFSRPGSVAIRNTLDAAGVFNDQLRVVSP